MSDSHPASYYVPDEIIYCFVDERPLTERSEPLFKSEEDIIERLKKYNLLPNPDRIRRAENGLALEQFYTVLPVPDQSGQSLVLATLRLQSADDLPAFIEQAVSGTNVASDAPKWVMPNWYGGVSGHIGTGGPGGKPQPLPLSRNPTDPTSNPTKETTRFELAGLPPINGDQRGVLGKVDVYILDTLPDKPINKLTDKTAPSPDSGSDPAAPPAAPAAEPPAVRPVKMDEHIDSKNGFVDHPLGALLAGEFEAGDADTSKSWTSPGGELKFTWAEDLCPGVFDSLFEPDHITPTHFVEDHDSAQDEPYEVSDHGIFIAGIIKQIAPEARIHIIQVLDRYGVGTLQSVANGFAYLAKSRSEALADLRKKNPDATLPPYIVNCSFTFTTPVLDLPIPVLGKDPKVLHRLPEEDKLGGLMNDAGYQEKTQAFFKALIPSQENLQTLVNQAASNQDCLVIAAAGNDSDLSHLPRKDARYPANVGSVLGVGALEKQSAGVWRYSNLSDTPITAGILTLGVVQNVFTQEFPGKTPNPTGYAEWAGTSFATAVMTGYVAQVCIDLNLRPLGALGFLGSIVQINPLNSEAMLMVSQPNAVPMP